MAHAYVAQNIKHLNRKYVFDIIRDKRELTRSEVGRITGISAPTMLKIFDYFLGIHLISERGELDSPIGRRANLFVFNPNSFYTIGVDYSGDMITIGLVNLDNEIVKMKKVILIGSFLDSFDCQIYEFIADFIDECDVDRHRILGVGIGCPTTVNENNIILFAPLMGVFSPIDMSQKLEDMQNKLDIPVYLENDTNAAAKGEFESQRLSDESSIVFISLKRGLGAGIVMKGDIWHGSQHLAGEIGYLVFKEDYTVDTSKPGWMEEEFINGIKSTSNMGYEDILKICSETDAAGRLEIIRQIAGKIALVVTNIAVVLDVNNFVIGGAIAQSLQRELILAVKKIVDRLSITKIKINEETCVNPVIVGMGEIVCEKEIESIIG